MNAKRAREITEKNILDSSNELKSEIDSKIEKAIEKKRFQFTSYNVPGKEEKEVLIKHYTDLGFTIEQHFSSGFNDQDSITFIW